MRPVRLYADRAVMPGRNTILQRTGFYAGPEQDFFTGAPHQRRGRGSAGGQFVIYQGQAHFAVGYPAQAFQDGPHR